MKLFRKYKLKKLNLNLEEEEEFGCLVCKEILCSCCHSGYVCYCCGYGICENCEKVNFIFNNTCPKCGNNIIELNGG